MTLKRLPNIGEKVRYLGGLSNDKAEEGMVFEVMREEYSSNGRKVAVESAGGGWCLLFIRESDHRLGSTLQNFELFSEGGRFI